MLRKIAAAAGILGVISVLIYGPLFHVHPETAELHAHLEDFDSPQESTEPAFDHSHEASQHVDVFVIGVPSTDHQPLVLPIKIPLLSSLAPTHHERVAVLESRAHDPPSLIFSDPRSPPRL